MDTKEAVSAFFVTAAAVAFGTVLAIHGCKTSSTASVQNTTDRVATVYLAFGADSQVLPSRWPFCVSKAPLTCQFPLAANATQVLDIGSSYLNATLAFDAQVGCGSTKAELNLNNPDWHDTLDVSLVDGFNRDVELAVADSAGAHSFEAKTAQGNQKASGVFPLGCDICVARQSPPCGMSPGKDGCKSGPDQYHPDVICQYQGPAAFGGSAVVVRLY